jgi:hypothetical protein
MLASPQQLDHPPRLDVQLPGKVFNSQSAGPSRAEGFNEANKISRDSHSSFVIRHSSLGSAQDYERGSISKLISTALAECVTAPTLIRSTPVAAMAATVASVTPPLASSSGRRVARVSNP